MKQPNAREFVEKSEKYGDVWRRVAVVTCRECGGTESLKLSQGHSLLPPSAIQKRFTQKGWAIGSNEHWDVCPTCAEHKKIAKPHLTIVEKEEPEMKLVDTATTVPEAPRTMQRDDRRIIFQKLNEVYLDEKRGYDNGWSDLRVSKDLGVPRAWVAQVRDENFGPVAANPDIDEFKRGLEELSEMKKNIAELQKLLAQFDINSLTQKISRLERLGVEVAKHIP